MTGITSDEILYGKLDLFQPERGPRVNVDTILLSAFAKIKYREKAIELGCAHGAVSLLMALRYPGASCIEGIEIQEDLWSLGVKNIRRNGMQEKVRFIHGDLRNISEIYRPQSFDVVVVNPPYFDAGKSRRSDDKVAAIANHDLSCSIDDVVSAASYLLRDKGRCYMVFTAARVDELMAALLARKMSVKRIRPVYPRPGRKASVVLVYACRNAGQGVLLDSPLMIYDEDGNYTEDLKKAYEVEQSPCL